MSTGQPRTPSSGTPGRSLRLWAMAVLCLFLWTGCGLHKALLPALRPPPVPIAGSDQPQLDHLQLPETGPPSVDRTERWPKGSWIVLVGAVVILVGGFVVAELAGAELIDAF